MDVTGIMRLVHMWRHVEACGCTFSVQRAARRCMQFVGLQTGNKQEKRGRRDLDSK